MGMRALLDWLRIKHTSLTQAVATVIASGQILGWWDLTADQIAAITALVGVLWLIIGAQTTTSNLRLTDRAWAGPSGVDHVDVVIQGD